MKRKETQVFIELVKAGLWEKEVQLLPFGEIDYNAILKLAEEQSVVGLVAAGLEQVKDVKTPQEWALQFAGQTLQLEQRNKAMNDFVAKLIEDLRKADVYCLLVKGQGVAQCYEKPLWRASGDVDLLLSKENYEKAKAYLIPRATSCEEEAKSIMHLGLYIDSWVVELHGGLRSGVLHKMDKLIDEVQRDIMYHGNVRSWNNEKTQIFLPSIDNDIIIIFTHILKHFFHGGIGMRQICDWCRLLWTYRGQVDVKLLEKRLIEGGIMSEWKVFGAMAVRYLGMPSDAMPLYSQGMERSTKVERALNYIMDVGNFGHNRDLSYYSTRPYIVRKAISFSRRITDGTRHLSIFPMDSLKVFLRVMFGGVKAIFERR